MHLEVLIETARSQKGIATLVAYIVAVVMVHVAVHVAVVVEALFAQHASQL